MFMRKLLALAVLSSVVFLSPQAYSDDLNKNAVSFQINHSVLVYESTVTKTTNNETAEKNNDSSEIQTFPTDLEIAIGVNDWMLYARPLNSGSTIQVGRTLNDNLEIGLAAGYVYNKAEDLSEETTTTEYGFYGVYGQPVLKDLAVELSLGLSNAYIRTETHLDENNSDTKIRTQLVSEIACDAVYTIDDHFAYVGGVFYTSGRYKSNTNVEKSVIQTLGVNIASFRYMF